jgi:small subunit ribosomal protein S2
MENVDIKSMLENAVHFGHRTQKWNPKMRRFLHTEKGGIHVFDLSKTRVKLLKMLEELKKLSSEGKTILFVSTKPQAIDMVTDLAKATGSPYVSYKWINGTLTNFSTIKKRVTYLKHLKEDAAASGFDRYTKKEAGKFRKEMIKLEQNLGGISQMNKMPDALFIVDAHRDKNAVLEAKTKRIPVFGIADSNVDPGLLTHFVPANDDAMKSLTFILGLVKEAILEGKKGGKPAPEVKGKEVKKEEQGV